MFRFGSFFLVSVYSLMLKILGLIYKHVYRSKSSLAEENGSNFSANRSQLDDEENLELQSDKNDSNATTASSVLLQSGLVSKNSKCQVISGENLSGFVEEPKTVKFVVQELFVGSDYVVVSSDQTLGSETCDKNDLFEQNLEENREELEQESELSPFYFKLLNASFSTTEETRENLAEMENISEKGKEEKPEFCDFQVEGMNGVEDEDFAYEVELIPSSHPSSVVADQESDANGDDGKIEKNDSDNWMSSFLDQTDQTKSDDLDVQSLNNSCEEVGEDLDDEYIELEPQESASSSSSCADADQSEELRGQNAMQDSSQEGQNCWDSDSDCDEDEPDVLSDHQHLVQQMKMELKNCRIRGLPTISEESETPKMIEDLRPLEIDHKIGYKDVMEGIHKFYKSYAEKMRKLDILNYQTSHAISFLQLKEPQVYTAGKKKGDSSTFVLPKIWAGKVRRIYADPMHKSINEMHRDLELVYVGQVCLSWEILCWMDVRARELLEYDGEGKHSYNRAAEEFQQFQVLVQRFMEDEQFQGRRDENYVRSRCMIRSLLQVPTIKDDKERRKETDAITLEMLVEFIKESMLIFHEFVVADKKATNAGLTKVDLQESGSSELLLDVVSSLQKKERRMREQIRSQNCIVKKLKKHLERRSEREILTSQVELRLVWRVLNMPRLSEDRLVWCRKKLNNISFVGRKVQREASFLLFPC